MEGLQLEAHFYREELCPSIVYLSLMFPWSLAKTDRRNAFNNSDVELKTDIASFRKTRAPAIAECSGALRKDETERPTLTAPIFAAQIIL